MTATTTTAGEAMPAGKPVPAMPRHMLPRLAALCVLVAAADQLFLTQSWPGLSAAIYAAMIGGIVLAFAAVERDGDGGRLAVAGLAALAGIAPLVESFSVLSMTVAAAALAAASLLLSAPGRRSVTGWTGMLGAFFVTALGRLPVDVVRWRQAILHVRRTAPRGAALLAWVMPLGLTVLFLGLFAEANPLIERALKAIDLLWLLERIDIGRMTFWAFMALASWPFLKPYVPKLRVRMALKPREEARSVETIPVSLLFGPGAILRALVSFNLLFAVQSVLDIAYLWGGVALPDGMTHAEYAHRGAYPLIVTALLAAGFVLLAMRPGSETSGNRLIRGLVYAWVAQNVLLVVSSILRLDLYVSVYSLTYWRIAAFVWMMLVAAGLCLIMARIALGLSNGWLVSANLALAAAVLYGCTAINFAGIIADWNVDHAARNAFDGRRKIDAYYLASLGPQALPATRRLLNGQYLLTNDERTWLQECAVFWTGQLERQNSDWRSWSWRGWRLSNAVAAGYDAVATGGAADSPAVPDMPAASRPEQR